MSETRIVISRDATKDKPPGRNSAAESEAKAAARSAAEEIRARRRQIHQQADIDISGAAEPEQQQEQAPVREDLDSIEITMRDGRVIEYGPPRGISLSDRIARLFSGRPIPDGGPDPGMTEYRLTRVLMGVRAIDGRPVSDVTNLVQRTVLANRLGDEALDLLFYYDRLHWPPLTEAELPSIKKNLRQR